MEENSRIHHELLWKKINQSIKRSPQTHGRTHIIHHIFYISILIMCLSLIIYLNIYNQPINSNTHNIILLKQVHVFWASLCSLSELISLKQHPFSKIGNKSFSCATTYHLGALLFKWRTRVGIFKQVLEVRLAWLPLHTSSISLEWPSCRLRYMLLKERESPRPLPYSSYVILLEYSHVIWMMVTSEWFHIAWILFRQHHVFLEWY